MTITTRGTWGCQRANTGDAGMTQRKADREDGVLEVREAIRDAELARRKRENETQTERITK